MSFPPLIGGWVSFVDLFKEPAFVSLVFTVFHLEIHRLLSFCLFVYFGPVFPPLLDFAVKA